MGNNYDRFAATERAIELAKLAVQSGLFTPINAVNFANADSAGRDAAAYLAGFVAELADRIEKL